MIINVSRKLEIQIGIPNFHYLSLVITGEPSKITLNPLSSCLKSDPFTQNMGSINSGVTHNLGIEARMAKRFALEYSWVQFW